MKIIDIHTHIYPDAIARKATDSVRDFYQIDGAGMDGTVEMLRERGKMAGIDQYVVLPVSNSPKRVRHINEFLLELESGMLSELGRILRLIGGA